MRVSGGRWVIVGLLVASAAYYAHAEDITLTTIYPSPRGVYQELHTVGETILAEQSGNVGIRTNGPTQTLDVNGVIRIRGGGPGANECWTATDALGNGTWALPVAVYQ